LLSLSIASCLDRTNVAQFSAGVEAIGQQLVVMGIRSKAKLDPSATTVRVLIDMYVDIGDSIALQYGGSEAHKKVSAESSESNITPIGKASLSSLTLRLCHQSVADALALLIFESIKNFSHRFGGITAMLSPID